ncbi:hypothetical protein FB451DRAFT_1355027 [Mycena latifolia]|nr:hypothetical protein FB451DRAFT_1355027 [Mycena latifolia]
MKLAIVGGGPSAFYVASRLLSRSSNPKLGVHVFDRLWAPHGLVRYGVAPDHPEVKNCTHKFDAVAADPRFRFFGNVNVGVPRPPGFEHAVQVPIADIYNTYSHLLFATGCTVPARHGALGPGSPFCMPALSFVHWYTQHPSAPPAPPLDQLEHVTLIGNGNVALDVARMLLAPPAHLAKYDVPAPVLAALARSAVRHVSIVARRGPLQAAFTAKELRELTNLPDVAMVPLDPALLAVPPGTVPARQQARVLQLLAQGSRANVATARKTWALEFFKAPTGVEADPAGGARLQLVHTALDGEGRAVQGEPAPPLRTSLVLPSLGFRAEPDAPFFDAATGHLRAEGGRVLGADGRGVRGVYASGWAAMGARGVLAATMMDAYGVADRMLADTEARGEASLGPPTGVEADGGAEPLMNPTPADGLPPAVVQAGCSAGRVVEYPQWKSVDEEEVRRGAALGKERERMQWPAAGKFLWGDD